MLGHHPLGRVALGQIAELTVNEYALTADAAAFTLTGIAAGVTAERTLEPEAGSFVLTGVAAGVTAERTLAMGAGSYVLTGMASGFRADRILVATPNTERLGQSYVLFAALGERSLGGLGQTEIDLGVTFQLSGQDAVTRFGRFLQGGAGAFIVTGQDIDLDVDRILHAEAGTFVVTGVNAAVVADRVLQAAPGAFTVTGIAPDLVIVRRKILAFPRVGRLSGTVAARTTGGGMRARSYGG